MCCEGRAEIQIEIEIEKGWCTTDTDSNWAAPVDYLTTVSARTRYTTLARLLYNNLDSIRYKVYLMRYTGITNVTYMYNVQCYGNTTNYYNRCMSEFLKLKITLNGYVWHLGLNNDTLSVTHVKNCHSLLTRCVRNRLVGSLRRSCNTAVISPSCYKLVVVNLGVATCYVQAMSGVLGQLVTSPIKLSSLLQDANNLFQIWQTELRTSSANTSWYRLDGQTCCNLLAAL